MLVASVGKQPSNLSRPAPAAGIWLTACVGLEILRKRLDADTT